MSDLVPCPFCGSSSVVHAGTRVECMDCGARGPWTEYEAARAAWNRRADLGETVQRAWAAAGAARCEAAELRAENAALADAVKKVLGGTGEVVHFGPAIVHPIAGGGGPYEPLVVTKVDREKREITVAGAGAHKRSRKALERLVEALQVENAALRERLGDG